MSSCNPQGGNHGSVARAMRADRALIRERWREYKAMVPGASAFFFIAEIVRTGRLPAVPRKQRK